MTDFSAIIQVYPCDKCHDEQQPHPAEHANRMICGRCSREQNYKPNDCAYCGHEFMRKSTGYWEGGKGETMAHVFVLSDILFMFYVGCGVWGGGGGGGL